MLYVPICDETNKLESIRLKRKVEIKGENVSMISPVWAQRPTGPLICALIGGAQPHLVGGPLSPAPYIKRWGAGVRITKLTVHPLPPDTPYRSRVSARPTGSSITAATLHTPALSPPSPTASPWPPALARQAKEKVKSQQSTTNP